MPLGEPVGHREAVSRRRDRSTPETLFETVLNPFRFHREHEKFYAEAPLEQAASLQRASRTLKTLAERGRRPSRRHGPRRRSRPDL
jgi:hypothetical protein